MKFQTNICSVFTRMTVIPLLTVVSLPCASISPSNRWPGECSDVLYRNKLTRHVLYGGLCVKMSNRFAFVMKSPSTVYKERECERETGKHDKP